MGLGAYRGGDQVGTVAVIGAGLIGAGWIAHFLAKGLVVRVHDPAPDVEARVRTHVDACWPQLCSLNVVLTEGEAHALTFHSRAEEAASGADFIQENAAEQESVKADLYRQLDAVAPPDVLIASSTSSFPVSAMQAFCGHPSRCVLGHPFNPVHLLPLVEVGGGQQTDIAAVDAAMTFYRAVGKRPIRLRGEMFGHVANRLASAMLREAVHLVDKGVATVEDIDDALRFGPALKWAIQGQFMTYYTSGGAGGMARFLDAFGPGHERRWRDLGDPALTPDLKAKIVAQTEEVVDGRAPGQIAAEQDEKLLRLLHVLGC